jgi:hypothetical protein
MCTHAESPLKINMGIMQYQKFRFGKWRLFPGNVDLQLRKGLAHRVGISLIGFSIDRIGLAKVIDNHPKHDLCIKRVKPDMLINAMLTMPVIIKIKKTGPALSSSATDCAPAASVASAVTNNKFSTRIMVLVEFA